MRMRAARKRSSLAAGADIRTTGIVQLDASRPEKRPRSGDWSFADTANQAGDEQAAAAAAAAEAAAATGNREGTPALSSPRLEQPLDTDVRDDKVLMEQETLHKQDGICKEEQGPTLVKAAMEQKKFRHFSRSKQQKGRVLAEASSPASLQQQEEKKTQEQRGETKSEASDAASTSQDTTTNNNKDVVSVEENNHRGKTQSRYSLRKNYVDFYEIPEELLFFDDDLDEQELPKAKVRKKKKQEKSQTRVIKGKVGMIEECLNFLEQMGLFKNQTDFVESNSVVAVHPGSVGDGSVTTNCKVCGLPENSTSTLVCDICEETYHLSCCYPKVRSIPRDDRWLCSVCTRKRKKKTTELKIYPAGQLEEKLPTSWKLDRTKIRGWDLQSMERTQVRVGDEFQALVPDWCGEAEYNELRPDYPGLEVPRSFSEKLKEKELAEKSLATNIWPMGWLPAKSLSDTDRENWLQCQNIMFEEGDYLPNGEIATKDIICGKWRRAPLQVLADDGWECSCAVAWDPRHADCAVPQEISTEEIRKRPKARMQSPAEELKMAGRRGASKNPFL